MQDLPLEVISYFIQSIDDAKTLEDLLLSNSIFRTTKKIYSPFLSNEKLRKVGLSLSTNKQKFYNNGKLEGESKELLYKKTVSSLGTMLLCYYVNGKLEGECKFIL